MPEQVYLGISAVLIGMSKAGMAAMGNMAAAVAVFGIASAKEAVGLVVMLAIVGDIGAIIYYHKKIEFSILLRVLPLTFLGMTFAFLFGKNISELGFLIAITALTGIALIFLLKNGWRRLHGKNIVRHNGKAHYAVIWSCAIFAGVCTVLGSGAALFMNLYLFELDMKKNQFVSTLAMFYFIVNMIKLVVYIFYWESVNMSGAMKILPVIPLMGIGLAIGVVFIRKLEEKHFTQIIMFSGVLAFFVLILKIYLLLTNG